MNKNITTAFAVLFLLLFLLTACSFPFSESGKNSDSSSLTVATWNVQNLFNAVDEGNEYDEYRTSSGWNQAAYETRLSNLATVFSYFSADIVILNEVENESVVRDIITKLNAFPNYCTAKEENGAISIAVISKYPISHSCIHSVTGTRPILEAEIDTPNGIVRIFAIHGKSKRDGEQASAEIRRNMGETLQLVSKQNDDNLVILAGDFNEDICENNIFCDVRYGITDAPIKVSPSYGSSHWYNPFADPEISFDCEGTYYYNSTWSHLDNIICSYSPAWSISDSEIICKGILLTADKKPNSYNRSLLTGVSDHLPVVLRFEY